MALRHLSLLLFLLWVLSIAHWIIRIGASPLLVLQWWFVQWIPFESIARPIEQLCWQKVQEFSAVTGQVLQLPDIDVQEHGDNILSFVERKYGPGWRSKPLLLRNMWTQKELSSEDRRLSLKGLLQENMVVPYFTNVSRPGALVPDAEGRISDIVANISSKALPHKIGSQLLAHQNPELVYEVAPNHIVTQLFGNYFSPTMVRGFFNGLLPPITIIPLFIAKANYKKQNNDTCSSEEQPRTDMHCEPIANILVQLEGEKRITLISPEYSLHVQPRTSPDGRPYIYSMSPNFDHVPRFIHTIQKGDAIYVPSWTWHRVDYTSDKDIAISGSLFHFRPLDFFRRNPLHAAVIVPNLLMELTGLKAQ
jgi:hypothetical protein